MNDKEWSSQVAALAADALVDAGIIQRADFKKASDIIAEEIVVRLCMEDRPDKRQEFDGPKQL